MMPLPKQERMQRAFRWFIDIPLMWLGGMTWKAASQRFHWWVWYD